WQRERQLDYLGQLLLAASVLLAYARLAEPLLSWQAGAVQLPSIPSLCACAAPQLLWSRKLRGSPGVSLAVAALVCAAAFVDRAVTVLAPQGSAYLPTWVDGGLVLGGAM